MSFTARYASAQPALSEIESLTGTVLLEFGTDWCGHCQRAQAPVADALQTRPALPHLKIEDGPGRPVGRHFRVKLWPTLVLLRDGVETGRLVRPLERAQIEQLLEGLSPRP